MFDDKISTVPLMREDTIPPNWTDIVQHSSQIDAPDNIGLKDTWFTPNSEVYPRKPPSHELSLASKNNNNTLTPLHSVPHVHESTARKGAPVSTVIQRPDFEVVRNTSI